MTDSLYPRASGAMAARRRDLAPETEAAFLAFSQKVFEAGALSGQVKQLIALAVAHVTQCPYCIRGHSKAAVRAGATEAQIMEAIWVAAEMRAGAAYAHAGLALDTLAGMEHRAAGHTSDHDSPAERPDRGERSEHSESCAEARR